VSFTRAKPGHAQDAHTRASSSMREQPERSRDWSASLAGTGGGSRFSGGKEAVVEEAVEVEPRGMDPEEERVGDDALELMGEEAVDEEVEEGVEVLGGANSLQRKKLAELMSEDSANCRFCCSKNFFRSLWNEMRRDVLAEVAAVP